MILEYLVGQRYYNILRRLCNFLICSTQRDFFLKYLLNLPLNFLTKIIINFVRAYSFIRIPCNYFKVSLETFHCWYSTGSSYCLNLHLSYSTRVIYTLTKSTVLQYLLYHYLFQFFSPNFLTQNT